MTAPLLTTSDLGDLSPMRAVRVVADSGLRPVPPAITAAIARIDADPVSAPLVRRLVQRSGMSHDAFTRAFDSATGMTPQRYITEARMRVARELLTTAVMPVESVARRVGYQSHAAFCVAFHAENGVSPTEFRAAHWDGA